MVPNINLYIQRIWSFQVKENQVTAVRLSKTKLLTFESSKRREKCPNHVRAVLIGSEVHISSDTMEPRREREDIKHTGKQRIL